MHIIKNLSICLFLSFSFIFTSCSGEKSIKISANEAAEAVLENVDFPKMTALTEKKDLIKYIGIDFEYIEDVSFYWQAISVELAEVLIIIPKTGKESDALDFANARRDKIMNDTEFYPSQEEAANASVSGIQGNVVYFICGNEADKAEEYLIKLLA